MAQSGQKMKLIYIYKQEPTVQHRNYIQYPVINHNEKEYEKEYTHIYITHTHIYLYN